MQFAIINGQPVQAGKDAPKYAQCCYCGREVFLQCYGDKMYLYYHWTDYEAESWRDERDAAQLELDRACKVVR